jgi:hypothetical protein
MPVVLYALNKLATEEEQIICVLCWMSENVMMQRYRMCEDNFPAFTQ